MCGHKRPAAHTTLGSSLTPHARSFAPPPASSSATAAAPSVMEPPQSCRLLPVPPSPPAVAVPLVVSALPTLRLGNIQGSQPAVASAHSRPDSSRGDIAWILAPPPGLPAPSPPPALLSFSNTDSACSTSADVAPRRVRPPAPVSRAAPAVAAAPLPASLAARAAMAAQWIWLSARTCDQAGELARGHHRHSPACGRGLCTGAMAAAGCTGGTATTASLLSWRAPAAAPSAAADAPAAVAAAAAAAAAPATGAAAAAAAAAPAAASAGDSRRATI
eukprot:82319-Chlamydomonas_euryale.AAC.3